MGDRLKNIPKKFTSLGITSLIFLLVTVFSLSSIPFSLGFDTNAVVISGHMVNGSEFILVPPFECGSYHLHPATGSSVKAFDGTVIEDPDPGPAPPGCGYGTLLELFWIVIPHDLIPQDDDHDFLSNDLEIMLGLDPNNPDTDGDGIPDGSEDLDGDGLTNSQEVVLGLNLTNAFTTPGIPDNLARFLSSTPKNMTKIPVIINILNNSGVDIDHIKDAIDVARDIHMRDKINPRMFVIVRINDPAPDPGGDDGVKDDGNLVYTYTGQTNESEELKAINDGIREVQDHLNGTGMKFIFAKDIGAANNTGMGASTSPGYAYHKKPVIVVEQRATVNKTGATIAHEVGHTLTLSGLNHTHPTAIDGDEENDGDANIMNPSNAGRDAEVMANGTKNLGWSPLQEAHIESHAPMVLNNWGHKGTMESPGQKAEQQRGNSADFLDDSIGPPFTDIVKLSMSSEVDDPFIHTIIDLGGLFPETGAFDVSYGIQFDTDDDLFTGFGPFPGIDKEVMVRVLREGPSGPPSAVGIISDFNTFIDVVLLPYPQITLSEKVFDIIGETDIFNQQIQLDIRKSDLGFTVSSVPGALTSRDLPDPFAFNTEFDSTPFIFDREFYLNTPTLTLFTQIAKPGDTIEYEIDGLTPNTSFDLSVDHAMVVSATTNSTGDYNGNFVFPNIPEGFHFLTAQDAAAAFAFNGVDGDNDNDTIADREDNCPHNANVSQLDSDGDGIGDVCEGLMGDSDGDGILDINDNCPSVSNFGQNNIDADTAGDLCDTFNVIKVDTIVSSDFTSLGNLIVQDNSRLTIQSGVTVTIQSDNNITIKAGSEVLIKSDGALQVNS